MKQAAKAAAVAAALLLALTAALPAAAAPEETVLTVYCPARSLAAEEARGAFWEEDAAYDVNDAFSAWYKTTSGASVTVRLVTCENDQTLWQGLAAEDCDLALLPDYLIGRALREDRLTALDYTRIPNGADVDASYSDGTWQYDAGNRYSVPYMSGYMGIVYNADLVGGSVNHWDALWDEAFKGKILMTDNARDAFAIALAKNGFDINTNNSARWQKAREDLDAQRALAQICSASQIVEIMQNGGACLAPCSYGDYLRMKNGAAEGVNLSFGTVTVHTARRFTYALCLPAQSRHSQAAEAYVNFLCGYEAGVANANYTGGASPLTAVRGNTGDAYYHFVGDPGVYPSQTVLSGCAEALDAGENLQRFLDDYTAGATVRTGDIWLYAGIGAAAAAAVVLLAVRLAGRKRPKPAKRGHK